MLAARKADLMRSGAGLARRRKWARAWYARNYKGQDGKVLYEGPSNGVVNNERRNCSLLAM
jgi:hypothetical protein